MQQDTKVKKTIFKNDPIVQGHPNDGDKDNYFPVITSMKSVNYGPINIDSSKREELVNFEEINYGLNKLKITDSNVIDNARDTSFVNIVGTRTGTDSRSLYLIQGDDSDRHLIYVKFLMVSNEGHIYSRKVTSLLLELCRIGGMLKIMTAFGGFAFWWFVQPYRDLDLSISFNHLKNKICQEEKIVDQDYSFDGQYESKLGCCFYMYFWFAKRTPFCFSLCCKSKPSKNI